MKGDFIMADNEKTAGVPIEDEALDKVAGGFDISDIKTVSTKDMNKLKDKALNNSTNTASTNNKPVSTDIPINSANPEFNNLLENINSLKSGFPR